MPGGMTLRAYAERISVNEKAVYTWKSAAEVAVLCAQNFETLTGKVQHLSLIHAAPQETLRAYAERIGVNEETVSTWKRAADVAVLTGQDFATLTEHMRHLVAIHAAPQFRRLKSREI